jgi:hypothetical protein
MLIRDIGDMISKEYRRVKLTVAHLLARVQLELSSSTNLKVAWYECQ